METILKYLSQQSTWKGLIALIGACGVCISPDLSNAIVAVVLAIIGLINVIIDERKKD